MLNHKNNVHKAQKSKSKIFITILCIFGLLFSWSCSCKNKVTGPGNDGLENGRQPTPNDGETKGTFAPKTDSSSQLSLIASEDGTAKTEVTISFLEENSHNIKSAKVTKIVDTNGNDITDKATYAFSDSKFSFNNQSDLKGVLDGMDSTSGPATNTLTVTFELTTDSTKVSNTTATVDVNVYLVKTQKLNDQSTILKDIISGLGSASVNSKVRFDFSNGADIASISLENAENNGEANDNGASQFIGEIITTNGRSIKNSDKYKEYFDDVTETHSGVGTETLTIKLTFTPKKDIIYDMTLTEYTITLNTKGGGNWID